ncbi:MAG: BON domain-containing protein [Deltaproteobacteria bacterium]|nr:BON domain-containing protein [Deltaproteobacteria bacterium]
MIRFNRNTLVASALTLALAATISVSSAQAQIAETGDQTTLIKVEQRLANRGFEPATGVYSKLNGGVVTLTGSVETLRQSVKAERAIAKIRGVQRVDNHLEVASFGRPDESIRKDIQNTLDTYLSNQVFDWVEARVESGQVLLTGQVDNPSTQARIQRAITKVPGVWRLVNSVETLPVSLFDDEVRSQALVAIYSHPAFVGQGLLNNPSIHILVSHGRIALKGTVATLAQKRLAESLVRSGTLSYGVDNQILISRRIRS